MREGSDAVARLPVAGIAKQLSSPLDPAGFDAVINPAGVESVVQITCYLKIRYR
jgi:hypothetical protein